MALFTPRVRVPLGTWIAPTEIGGALQPVQIGVEHAMRVPVRKALLDPCPHWLHPYQDKPYRGFVSTADPDAPATEVVEWLCNAVLLLCPLPTIGDFTAAIHTS